MQPGSSKGKIKPPTLFIWDGIQDPMSIVQRRLKKVNSLRNRETGEEYTLEDLRKLSGKVIIIGSMRRVRILQRYPKLSLLTLKWKATLKASFSHRSFGMASY